MQLFRDAFTSLKFGELKEFGNLKLTPIFIDEAMPPEGFVGFDELFDKGLVDASELSESGVVGRISVTNKSDSYLVLLDGEALVGAKQNRIVERSMIIGPQSRVSVPVNCVERGRWSYDRRAPASFRKADFAATPSMKMSKAAMIKNKLDHSIQSEMWASVDRVAASHDVSSRSDNLGEIFDKSDIVDQYDIEVYIEKMNAHGFIVEGVKHPFIELFCYPRFCTGYCKKAVRAWLSESRLSSEQRISKPEELKTVNWELSEAFGLENAWVPKGDSTGRLIQSKSGQLIHMFWGSMT